MKSHLALTWKIDYHLSWKLACVMTINLWWLIKKIVVQIVIFVVLRGRKAIEWYLDMSSWIFSTKGPRDSDFKIESKVFNQIWYYIKAKANGCHFRDDIFKFIFLEWWVLYFDSNWSGICSQESKRQPARIRSDDSLALNQQQAIILTNDGPVYLCIHVSTSINGVICTVKNYADFLLWKHHWNRTDFMPTS